MSMLRHFISCGRVFRDFIGWGCTVLVEVEGGRGVILNRKNDNQDGIHSRASENK